MLEELAIGVLGYVFLDKICKDMEKNSRQWKENQAKWQAEKRRQEIYEARFGKSG